MAPSVEIALWNTRLCARDQRGLVHCASLLDALPAFVPLVREGAPVHLRTLGDLCQITATGGLACVGQTPPDLASATDLEREAHGLWNHCVLGAAHDVRCWSGEDARLRVVAVPAAHGARSIALTEDELLYVDEAGAAFAIARRGSAWAAHARSIELPAVAREVAASELGRCFWLEGDVVQCDGRHPVRLEHASGLVVGAFTACVVVDGHAQCWGSNDTGALGPARGSYVPPTEIVPGARGLSLVEPDFCTTTAEGARCLANGVVVTPAVAIHDTHAQRSGECVLGADGVYCFALDGVAARTGAPRRATIEGAVTALASARRIGCVLSRSELSCWGEGGGYRFFDDGDHEVPLQRFAPQPIATSVRALSSNMGEVCWLEPAGVRCVRGDQLGGPRRKTFDELAGAIAFAASIGWTCGAIAGAVRCVHDDGRTRSVVDLPIAARALSIGNGAVVSAVDLLCAATVRGAECVRLYEDHAGPSWTVEGVTAVEAIGVYGDLACAIASGSMWCWGPADQVGRVDPSWRSEVAEPRIVLGPTVR